MTYTRRYNSDAHAMTIECDVCEATIAVNPTNAWEEILNHRTEAHTRREGPGASPPPNPPDGSVSQQRSVPVDPRIQQFYDNAAAHGMSPGDYAVYLLGLPAILDVVELERQEGDEA